ncbi:MAG: acyltransferase family protein [Microbacterium sp.]
MDRGLGADNAPPIAQHYWSLSVEEQFYILWPLVVIVGMTWGARHRLMSVILGLTLASAIYSVIATFTAPSLAYFATPARVWEFGIGAIVALLPALSLRRRARAVIWAVSWIALLVSAFSFNASTPFPGYAALLPVIAAGAVIAVGPAAPMRFAELHNLRILQWLGDNSYGIYLWHWPLIVIAPATLGHELDLWENTILVVVTVLLAAASKRFVEDPLRFGSLKTVRPRTILIGVVASMAIVVAAAGIPITTLTASASAQTHAAQSRITDPSACQGASVLLASHCADSRYKRPPVAANEVVPSLAGLYDDTDGAFSCYNSDSSTAIVPCHIGSSAPDSIRVALTGDSHAAMLVPAMRDMAKKNNWSVDVYVGRGCVWSADPDPACETRQVGLTDALLTRGYSAIITTAWNQLGNTDSQRAVRSEQFAKRWASALDNGIRVIPVIDNPGVPDSSAECLSQAKSFSFDTCAFSAESALQNDPLALAASDVGIDAIDLRSAFCDVDGTCPMVAGSVVVYRDLHHITASFSHSLAPYLAEQISARLSRPIS